MSQGTNVSNVFKSMAMPPSIVQSSTLIDEDEDNVDAMEMAPSETSSMADHDMRYRPAPPTPYSNTNSSTMQYAGNHSKMEMSQNQTPQMFSTSGQSSARGTIFIGHLKDDSERSYNMP